jgi:hypothetical protein
VLLFRPEKVDPVGNDCMQHNHSFPTCTFSVATTRLYHFALERVVYATYACAARTRRSGCAVQRHTVRIAPRLRTRTPVQSKGCRLCFRDARSLFTRCDAATALPVHLQWPWQPGHLQDWSGMIDQELPRLRLPVGGACVHNKCRGQSVADRRCTVQVAHAARSAACCYALRYQLLLTVPCFNSNPELALPVLLRRDARGLSCKCCAAMPGKPEPILLTIRVNICAATCRGSGRCMPTSRSAAVALRKCRSPGFCHHCTTMTLRSTVLLALAVTGAVHAASARSSCTGGLSGAWCVHRIDATAAPLPRRGAGSGYANSTRRGRCSAAACAWGRAAVCYRQLCVQVGCELRGCAGITLTRRYIARLIDAPASCHSVRQALMTRRSCTTFPHNKTHKCAQICVLSDAAQSKRKRSTVGPACSYS